MDGTGQMSGGGPSAAESTDAGALDGDGERTGNQGGNGGAVAFDTSGAVVGENVPAPPTESNIGGEEEEEEEVVVAMQRGRAKAEPRWKLGSSACMKLSKKAELMETAGRKLLENAMGAGADTDMEFVLDSGRKVRGHKFWLMARSDYIRVMLSSGMQEAQTGVVPVRQCADGTFLALLEYLYTGKTSLSGHGPCDTASFLELGEMFQIEGLQGEISGETLKTLTAPPEALSKAGRKLFQDAMEGAELTDMEFALDSGKKIRGHKSWLMARCEGFTDQKSGSFEGWLLRRYECEGFAKQIGESTTGVVPVMECSDVAFLALLEFVYTGRLTGDTCMGQDWEELSMIAGRFGIEGMVDTLMDAVTLDEAEKAAHVAVKLGSTRLAETCMMAVRPPPTAQDTASRRLSKNWAIIVINVMSVICRCDCWGPYPGMYPDLQLGHSKLCRAMLVLQNDAEQQILGCIALRNAAQTTQNDIDYGTDFDENNSEEKLVACRTTTCAVMGALEHHEKNAQVQIRGLEALDALMSATLDMASEMSEALMIRPSNSRDGIGMILAALRNHHYNAEVQAAGCRLLVQLLKYHEIWDEEWEGDWEHTAGPESRIILLIEEISTALIDHKGSAEVQRMGNAALFYLVLGTHAPGRPWNESNGGVEAIVEALRNTDIKNKWVHHKGTQALLVLIEGTAEICRRAVQAGGIEAVVKALGSNIDDWWLQGNGCSALYNLVKVGDEYRSRAGQAGAVEAVIEALKQNMDDDRVKEYSCIVLAELSSDHAENRRRAGRAGGVKVVIDAIESQTPLYDTSVWRGETQFRATSALQSLVHNDDVNRSNAVGAGAIEAVVKALGWEIDDPFQLGDGCSALSALIKGSDDYRSRAGQAGAVEAVVEALKKLSDDDENDYQFQPFGLDALLDLVKDSPDRIRLAVDAGAVEVVENALKNHALDQTDKQTCDDLLSQFNSRLSKRSRRATERSDV